MRATPELTAARRALPSGEAARLYAEGLARLRLFDAQSAVPLLERAVQADPAATRVHAALAAALLAQGRDDEARVAARHAWERAAGLPREEVLFAEARLREAEKAWDRAIEVYRALFDAYPDSIEYGLALAGVQSAARKGEDALATVERIRALSADDPRIDLAEAEAARTISDFRRQEAAANRAKQKAHRIGATLLLARAHHASAWAARHTNRSDFAVAEAERARALFVQKGDRWGAAAALNVIGAVEFDRGRLTAALEAFEQMLEIGRATGDRTGIARGLNNTGLMMLHLGNLAGAGPRYRAMLEISKQIGDTTGTARALNNLAEIPYLRADFDAAANLDRQALALARESGDRWLVANVLFDLGDVEIARGNLTEARAHHEQALRMRQELGDLGTASESQLSLCEIELASGRAAAAEKSARAVLEQVRGRRVDTERAAMLLLARALLAQGRRAEAEPVVQAALQSGRSSENPRIRLPVLALDAAFRGDHERVRALAREAERLGLRLVARQALRGIG